MDDGQSTPGASADAPDQQDAAPVPAGGVSLRSLFRRGALWSVAGHGGSQLLRFGGNMILTRMLFPEAFGLMGLVNALLAGLQLFSDIGIGPSIIQSRRGDDPVYLNSAWTVQICRGVVLWLVACAVAGPFADFYGEPQLAWIVPVSGLTALIAGFNSTRRFSMYRQVDLARVSVIELSCQLVGIVVMIVWAAVERSVSALVAGGLAGSLVRLVLTHTALPGLRNRLHWDRAAIGQLLTFGRWIFLSTVLTFMVSQSDRLIFGKMVPIAMLGIFGMGAVIATMPSAALINVAASVLFPVYSRMRNSGRDVAEVFTRVRGPLLILAAWIIAGLIGGGRVAVELAYDDRYAEAGWIVQALAFGTWFAVLEATNGSALLAYGQPKWTAASGAGKLLGMVTLIPLGYHLADFPGAVVGLAASETLRYAVSTWATQRIGLRSWPQDMRLTAWLFATAAGGWFVAGLARGQGLPVVAVAGAVFLAVTLLWVPPALVSLRASGARPRPGA